MFEFAENLSFRYPRRPGTSKLSFLILHREGAYWICRWREGERGGRGGWGRFEGALILFLTNTCERVKALFIDACAFLEQDQLLHELCSNSRLVD